MYTPEQRAHMSAIGRLGGLTTAATIDTKARAVSAQASFKAKFDNGHTCRTCPPVVIPDDLDPQERRRRSDLLYRLHFVRLAQRPR